MMISSSLFAFVAILSSLAASVNGAVVQRDTTYLTPQPTVPTTTATSTPSSSPTSTRPTTTSSSAPASSFLAISSSPLPSSGVTVPVSTNTTLPTQSGTPTGTGTGTPTPTGTGTVNCTGLQLWQASFAYSTGDRVIYVSQLYTAKQWTYNSAPPTHPDQWTAGGTCTQPINNQANCAGVSAWQSTVAYTAGNRVTYSGHLWTAVQWTEANAPGDTSGSWKDLGACA